MRTSSILLKLKYLAGHLKNGIHLSVDIVINDFYFEFLLDRNCTDQKPFVRAPYFDIINGRRNLDCALICCTKPRCVSFTITGNGKCMLYSHGGGDFCLMSYSDRPVYFL